MMDEGTVGLKIAEMRPKMPKMRFKMAKMRLKMAKMRLKVAKMTSLVPPWCLLGASSVPPCTPRLGPGPLRGHEKSSRNLIQIHNVPRATPKDAPKAANVAPQPLFCKIFGPTNPSKVPLGDPHKG